METQTELTIKSPEGYTIDEENSTFQLIKFKKKEKKEVKCWEDLEIIHGYYVCAESDIEDITNVVTQGSNKNVFATEEQAEASIALAMLSQLMKDVNGDWKPDSTTTDRKYVIRVAKNKVKADWFCFSNYFLSFPTEEIRDKFLENHRELIKQAKPFL